MSDILIRLRSKYPEMEPIQGGPSLNTVNGIGTTVYGNRDWDEETGTYVTTQVFALLFVPIFALKAYRVADAPSGGWYFLGRVPLSHVAKLWNIVVLLAIVVGGASIWWYQHTRSPGYIAREHLANGDALRAEGELGQAADAYLKADAALPADTRERMTGLTEAPLAAVPPAEAQQAWQTLAAYHRGHELPEFSLRAARRAQEIAEAQPATAVRLVRIAREVDPRNKDLQPLAEKILTAALAREPEDLTVISELAVLHEARQDIAGAEK